MQCIGEIESFAEEFERPLNRRTVFEGDVRHPRQCMQYPGNIFVWQGAKAPEDPFQLQQHGDRHK